MNASMHFCSFVAFGLAGKIAALSEVAPAPDRDQLDAGLTVFLCQRDEVNVGLPAGDELLRLHLFQGADLVTEQGGRFELQRGGRRSIRSISRSSLCFCPRRNSIASCTWSA